MKRAKAGDTVILECVPYGKPFPEIKWLKDGIEIEINDKIKVTLFPSIICLKLIYSKTKNFNELFEFS